jgi:endogenous inhibitor of DNA gyrase (YacG/DUF329 family)
VTFEADCPVCGRDVVSFAGPPTMYSLTLRAKDGRWMLATFSSMCLDCATSVVRGLADRHTLGELRDVDAEQANDESNGQYGDGPEQ